MSNQRGLSLIEVVISMAIFSLISISGAFLASHFVKEFKKIEGAIDKELEKDLAAKFLFRDLQAAHLAFNYLDQPDDNGDNFFDFQPTRPSGQAKDENRELTITADGRYKQIFLIIPDVKKSIPFPYSPAKAYNIPSPSTQINTTRPVTFLGVNNEDAVIKIDKALWQKDNWLLLHTPVWYNEAANSLPRQLRFLGRVSGQRLIASTNPGRYRQDPRSPAVRITDPDQFFRRLPAIGGGAPVVFLQKVQVISYEVVKEVIQGKSYNSLYRVTWNSGMLKSKATKVLVSKNINALKLVRNSIHKRVISVKIE